MIGYLTRIPHRVLFDAKLLRKFDLGEVGESDALKALYRGQWLTAKGEVGVLGPPISFTVPLGGFKANVNRQDDCVTEIKPELVRTAA